jgi:hypothetical protein
MLVDRYACAAAPDHDQPFCHCSLGSSLNTRATLELIQEHIRPLIAMIDRLKEAGVEEAKGDQQTTHAAGLQAQLLPTGKVDAKSESLATSGALEAAPSTIS